MPRLEQYDARTDEGAGGEESVCVSARAVRDGRARSGEAKASDSTHFMPAPQLTLTSLRSPGQSLLIAWQPAHSKIAELSTPPSIDACSSAVERMYDAGRRPR